MRRGKGIRLFADLYHYFLIAPWRQVIASMLAGYLVVNLLFAALYWLGGDTIENATPGSFRDAFFFSAQTLTTVGYGHLAPKGLYANGLACLESFLGLFGFAMGSGLMFAKFSRPTARVIFSQTAVIGSRDGKRCFMFRMANARSSQIFEARLSLVMILDEMTPHGEPFRRILDLKLVREKSPVFAQTWTAIHPIDESSPFWDETAESLEKKRAMIFLTLVGVEATFSQTVHTRYNYKLGQIRWNHRFVDVLTLGPDGSARIDYDRFHDTVPE